MEQSLSYTSTSHYPVVHSLDLLLELFGVLYRLHLGLHVEGVLLVGVGSFSGEASPEQVGGGSHGQFFPCRLGLVIDYWSDVAHQ